MPSHSTEHGYLGYLYAMLFFATLFNPYRMKRIGGCHEVEKHTGDLD